MGIPVLREYGMPADDRTSGSMAGTVVLSHTATAISCQAIPSWCHLISVWAVF